MKMSIKGVDLTGRPRGGFGRKVRRRRRLDGVSRLKPFLANVNLQDSGKTRIAGPDIDRDGMRRREKGPANSIRAVGGHMGHTSVMSLNRLSERSGS
jgi:hypothetical protein